MPQLVNTKTNQVEAVPQEAIQKALVSGTHNLVKGQELDMVNPDGEIFTIPSGSVKQALASGYNFSTTGQLTEAANEAKFGEGFANATKAAGAAAARTATLGLSDEALVKSGVVAPETLKELKERHPIASTIGDVAGIAAGSALGEGLLPVAGVLKAGKAVEGAVAAGLRATGMVGEEAGVAARILGQTAAKAAGSAVEGAAFGGAGAVTEHALGDPNLTAERVAAHIGAGALLGGTLGGLLGAGEIAVPEALSAAKEASNNTAQALGLPEAFQSVKKAVADKYATVASIASGSAKEDILAAIENRKLAGEPLEVGPISRSLQESFDKLESSVGKSYKDIRPTETERLVTNVPPEVAHKQISDVVHMVDSTISDMEARPALFPKRYPYKLNEIKEDFIKQVNPESSPAELFDKLNDFKKRLRQDIKFDKVANAEQSEAQAALKDLSAKVKGALEDDAVWGVGGKRQAAFNDAAADYFRSVNTQSGKGEFIKEFMYKVPGRGGTQFRIDPGKVKSFLNKAETPEGLKKVEALSNYLQSSQKMLSEIEESYKNVPNASFDKKAIQDLLEKNKEVIEQQKQQATLGRMAGNISDPGHSGILEGGALAYAAHALGVPHPLIGAAVAGLEAIRYPGATIQRLTKLEEAARNTTEKITKGARALARGGKAASSYLRGYAAEKLDEKQYKKVEKQIQGLSTNVEESAAHFEKATESLAQHAPRITEGLQGVGAKALNFLYQKLPSKPKVGPLAPDYIPSKTEMSEFAEYYKAVQHPTTILKDAVAGTLTAHGVEAVQTVYPGLFQEIKEHVLDQLTRSPGAVPYKQRMMLSLLLGMDVDGTMKPASIMQNQQQLAMAAVEEASKEQAFIGQPRAKGLDNLDRSQQVLTAQQTTAQRKA
jgi:hypothetical protein